MNCRVCGGGDLGEVLDLGLMPLVNNLLDHPEQECPRYPLKAVYCRDCTLVQLTESPPPSDMFEKYCYFSSQSRTMVTHAGELVAKHVRPGDRVIEIASNDGYLLRQAQARGAMVLGVDPARNIAVAANANGVPTLCDYFTSDLANRIVHDWGRADVLFANNVLAHVPCPRDMVAAIRTTLAPNGVAHVEVPYVESMLASGAFDSIYHEHQCYFSVTALKHLVNDHGLRLTDVRAIRVHGGSLHLEIRHDGPEDAAEAFVCRERLRGFATDRPYGAFRQSVSAFRTALFRELDLHESVAAYAAAAKGIVLLNYCGLNLDRVPWVLDASPHKQDKYVPGTRQPVLSPRHLQSTWVDAVLLLAWNLRDELVADQRTYLDRGGCFIIPFPRLQTLRGKVAA